LKWFLDNLTHDTIQPPPPPCPCTSLAGAIVKDTLSLNGVSYDWTVTFFKARHAALKKSFVLRLQHTLPCALLQSIYHLGPPHPTTLSKKPKQSALQDNSAIKPVSLGNFARFDSANCRWRLENGTEGSACTADTYQQKRRRAWVYLACNRALPERARVTSVGEPVACSYTLTVQSPEVCN
jgi:hypothetical protein